jgi:hypothetical protein
LRAGCRWEIEREIYIPTCVVQDAFYVKERLLTFEVSFMSDLDEVLF